MSKLKIYKASAGSGKTFKLTEEYLLLIFKSPYNYRHILAVTFTNDATEEMKSRIVREINNLAKGNKSDYIETLCKETKKSPALIKSEADAILNRLLHDYSRFSVGTIDSFFQRVIRAFTREVGLQAGYTIEMDHEAVLAEVVDNMIMDIEKDEELRDWLVRFAQERTEAGKNWNLEKEIKNLGSEIFKEIYKSFDKELIEKIQDKKFLDSFMQDLYKIQKAFESPLQDAAEKTFKILDSFSISVDDLSYKKAGPISFFYKIKTGVFESPIDRPRKSCGNPDAWSTKTSTRKADILAAVNSGINQMMTESISFFDKEYPKYNTALQVTGFIYTLGILTDISKRLKDYADENNIFLISNAPKLLSEIIAENDSPFIYEKTGTVYRNFMIDEFQDTSGMQWANFLPLVNNSLSENSKSLVVGDVKQSIYRWRNGDWKLLAGKIENDVKQYGSEIDTLEYNWRSKKNIIDFNNSLFNCASSVVQQHYNSAIDDRQADKILYLKSLIENLYGDLYQKSPVNTDNNGGLVNVTFIPPDEEFSWKEIALEKLPKIIENLQDNGYRPKDIAILVRSKSEGKEITDHLINYKNSESASSTYSYDLISNEALFVGSSSAVRLLVYLLRYFNNSEDKLNKALILHEYVMSIKQSENIPQELFCIDSDVSFFAILPEQFRESFSGLKSLPVFELTEKLIQIFSLHLLQSEIPYLQAFQDLVHGFGNDKSSDISSFLEWWDEKGISKTINISLQQDAMRVLTIHKSKGLEFKAVIIPFCNWPIDHDSKKMNILWCKPDAEPFNKLGLLPVKYSRDLANSYFSKEYYIEKIHAYIDNINLLYVALTRAENILHIIAPSPKKEGIGTVADLLFHSIVNYYENDNCKNKNYVKLGEFWNKDEFQFTLGTFKKCEDSDKSKKQTTEGLKLINYPTFDVHENLKLRLHSRHFFDNEKKINYGTIIHDVFKNIKTISDVDIALQQMVTEGRINSTEKDNLKTRIDLLLIKPEVQEWFNDTWIIKAEQAILIPDGKIKRPDRVMVKDNRAVVIDYKSGSKQPEHEEQVKEYVALLNEMGYSDVEGYLWYLHSNELNIV